MTKEYQRRDTEPVCGTAMCYAIYPGRSGKPYISVDAADFLIAHGYASFEGQLRRASRKRVRTVDMSRQETDSDYHGGIFWHGGNLDDEMFIVVGPNLSAAQVLKSLQAVIKRLKKRGIFAHKWSDGDYHPVGEQVTKKA